MPLAITPLGKRRLKIATSSISRKRGSFLGWVSCAVTATGSSPVM